MNETCSRLRSFLNHLEESRTASIAELETEARKIFPGARIDNRKELFLLIEFKTSLPCYSEVVKGWGEPAALIPPPSPPPIGPGQGRLKYASSEGDPYYWSGEEYRLFGRTLVLGTDRHRIKSVRIEPVTRKEFFKIDGKTVGAEDFNRLKNTLLIPEEETIRSSTDQGHIFTFEVRERGTNKKFIYEEEDAGDDRIYEIKNSGEQNSVLVIKLSETDRLHLPTPHSLTASQEQVARECAVAVKGSKQFIECKALPKGKLGAARGAYEGPGDMEIVILPRIRSFADLMAFLRTEKGGRGIGNRLRFHQYPEAKLAQALRSCETDLPFAKLYDLSKEFFDEREPGHPDYFLVMKDRPYTVWIKDSPAIGFAWTHAKLSNSP